MTQSLPHDVKQRMAGLYKRESRQKEAEAAVARYLANGGTVPELLKRLEQMKTHPEHFPQYAPVTPLSGFASETLPNGKIVWIKIQGE